MNSNTAAIETTKVGIKIMPRDVILDIQGRAVEESMKKNGFHLSACRVGKYIELEFQNMSLTEIQIEVDKMLKIGGLYNALIEKFEIQPLSNSALDSSSLTLQNTKQEGLC